VSVRKSSRSACPVWIGLDGVSAGAQAGRDEIRRIQPVPAHRLDRGEQRLGTRGLGPHRTVGAREVEQRGGLVGRGGAFTQALLDAQGERGVGRGGLEQRDAFAGRHRLHARRQQRHRCEGRKRYKTFAQPRLALD
jgi:hypothetical protein